MCLHNLDSSIKDKNFGYKIISKNGKARFFPSKVLPTEKWINEIYYRPNFYDQEKVLHTEEHPGYQRYSMGWHVFYTKKEALHYCNSYIFAGGVEIVRVGIKDILATGYQCSGNKYRTIVCKYIKIEKENKQ